MQFYEINISQIMIFSLYAGYIKYEMIKIDKSNKRKLVNINVNSRKCSNNFAADCIIVNTVMKFQKN